MKRKLVLFALVLIFSQQIFAQKASEVLENGVSIPKGHRLFLKYDLSSKILKVDAAKRDQDVDFTTLEDSTIFLARKNAVNIYLRPLNPLNYSYNTETKIIVDPINEAAVTALGTLIDAMGKVAPPKKTPPGAGSGNQPKDGATVPKTCDDFDDIQSDIVDIQKMLSVSQKEKVVKRFEALKNISFADEKSTINALNKEKDDIKIIEDYFGMIEGHINDAQRKVSNYKCEYPDPFTAKFVFNSILKDLSIAKDDQKKRLSNLQAAYNLVKEMQEKASIGGGTDDLKWCIPLDEVASKEGKIAIYTITLKESGYKLSDSQEIVGIESNDLNKKSLRIRKFQRFVPEVSVGTAFTFLKYYSYGTTSDESGQQYVGTPTENTIKNLNITTMLNLNYYIPNSPIHPLYQLGLGINSEMPTILTGVGLRSNINGLKRLAISGGIAMTWIKELDKLKVGDKITGTDDIDKDFKFSSAPKFAPYVSLQYNF